MSNNVCLTGEKPILTTEEKLCILFGCHSLQEVAVKIYAEIAAEKEGAH